MSFKKVICTIGLLALSANVFAAALSSDIKLKDIVLKPTESKALEFDKLISEVNYGITCTILSDGVSGQSEDDMQMQFGGDISIWLNHDDRVYDHQSFTLETKKPIQMEILEVYRDKGYAYIRNLDDTDTIHVTNCVAKPFHN